MEADYMTRNLSDFVATDAPKSKPASLQDALNRTAPAPAIEDAPLTEEERAALDGAAPEHSVQTNIASAEANAPPIDASPAPPADPEKRPIPDWAIVPPNLRIPPGRKVFFIRFRAEWTDRPDKGERQCIIWSLSAADEKHALQRASGEGSRMVAELTKQMIRAVDGDVTDWSRGPLSNVEKWWDEIGGKCRTVLQGIYHQQHALTANELTDFFVQCMEVRSAR